MPQSISSDTGNHPLTQAKTGAPSATESIAPTTSLPSEPKSNELSERLGQSPIAPDSAMAAALNDRIAIYKAAKAIHKSPAYVMKFVNAGLVKAYCRGGAPEHPWLVVNLSELLAVIERETLYEPPMMVGRKPRPRVERTALHPLAAAL